MVVRRWGGRHQSDGGGGGALLEPPGAVAGTAMAAVERPGSAEQRSVDVTSVFGNERPADRDVLG